MSEAVAPKTQSAAAAPPTKTASAPATAPNKVAPSRLAGRGVMTAPKIPPAPAPPKPSGRMSLAKVTHGKLKKPPRVLIYGVEGVGKSSFAADAPDPVFIGTESGTGELDVARFPEPTTWDEALEAITELTTGEHKYRTVVIDTLDWLEPLCWARTCFGRRDKAGKAIQAIEDFGYSKGYTYALEHWRVLVSLLERLRNERQMGVVLVAHSWIKSFKNPAGDDFDRYEMKLDKKAAGLLREWCDACLFAQFQTFTHKTDSGRSKGVSDGARVIYTERAASHDAKNRFDLPPALPLDWATFAEAVAEHRPADPERLKQRIEGLLELVDDGTVERVRKALEMFADDTAQLARIANKLAAQVETQESDEEEEAT